MSHLNRNRDGQKNKSFRHKHQSLWKSCCVGQPPIQSIQGSLPIKVVAQSHDCLGKKLQNTDIVALETKAFL